MGMRGIATLSVMINMLCSTISSHAQTAAEMNSYCQPIVSAKHLENGRVRIPTTFEAGRCWGAFDGVQQATRYVDANNDAYFDVCAPEASTLSQMIRVFSKHVDNNPQEAHIEWFPVAIDALSRAFPC